jgi:ribonuclease HI
VYPEIKHQHQTTKFALVFTGKELAVLKTLEITSESHSESFCIFSDSRSVLMCLNEKSLTKEHSVLILRIKEKLLALKKYKKDIKLVWIPGHMDIVLNEVTDVSTKDSI